MKDFILNLFSVNGNISMMRMLSFICVITASCIALYSVSMGRDLNAASVLCGVFLGAGISGKVMQKKSEVEVKNAK